VTDCKEVLSGDMSCQYGVSIQRFGDCVYLHHQGVMWWGNATDTADRLRRLRTISSPHHNQGFYTFSL